MMLASGRGWVLLPQLALLVGFAQRVAVALAVSSRTGFLTAWVGRARSGMVISSRLQGIICMIHFDTQEAGVRLARNGRLGFNSLTGFQMCIKELLLVLAGALLVWVRMEIAHVSVNPIGISKNC
jgi:hypothetical protein